MRQTPRGRRCERWRPGDGGEEEEDDVVTLLLETRKKVKLREAMLLLESAVSLDICAAQLSQR